MSSTRYPSSGSLLLGTEEYWRHARGKRGCCAGRHKAPEANRNGTPIVILPIVYSSRSCQPTM